MKSNCEECKLKDDCSPMYPCELSNKLEETRIELDNYKSAWNKIKDFIEDLQEGFENTFAYSNPQIEEIEDEMNRLEEKLLKDAYKSGYCKAKKGE